MNGCKRRVPWGAMLVGWLLALAAVRATELYYTDFENFTAGDDHWVGTDGWLGTSTNMGVHGIDSNALPTLGKTAFLGYNRPAGSFVTVLRPFNFNPVATNRPIVEFETLMGVQDSTNGHRDSFFFSFYNSSLSFLAAIRFSNEELTFGIWRADGSNQYNTGIGYTTNELHLLYARIDFSLNRWSAELDNLPLFTNAVFTVKTNALNLGYTAAEWQLSSTNPANHGDNWLLVGDWSVRALPKGEEPFVTKAVAPDASARPSIAWKGDKGFDYQVEYQSHTSQLWQTGLAGSSFSNNLSTGTVTFTDTTVPTLFFRKYRVTRRESAL
jgi:hypothetical protein